MIRAVLSDRSLDARSLSTQQQMSPGGNTLGKLKATRKGTGHPALLCRRLIISDLSIRHSPAYGIVHGTNLYFYFTVFKSIPFDLKQCGKAILNPNSSVALYGITR